MELRDLEFTIWYVLFHLVEVCEGFFAPPGSCQPPNECRRRRHNSQFQSASRRGIYWALCRISYLLSICFSDWIDLGSGRANDLNGWLTSGTGCYTALRRWLGYTQKIISIFVF